MDFPNFFTLAFLGKTQGIFAISSRKHDKRVYLDRVCMVHRSAPLTIVQNPRTTGRKFSTIIIIMVWIISTTGCSAVPSTYARTTPIIGHLRDVMGIGVQTQTMQCKKTFLHCGNMFVCESIFHRLFLRYFECRVKKNPIVLLN